MTIGAGETMRGTVVQSFSNEDDAAEAIRALQSAGFRAEDISVVAKDKGMAEGVAASSGTEAGEGAAAGLVTGGVLGGVVAALAGASAVALPGVGWVIGGTLMGVLVGAAGGAITGGLIGAGIPENEAKHYNERYKAGDIIVTVMAGDREAEARRVMQRDSMTDFGTGYRSTSETGMRDTGMTGSDTLLSESRGGSMTTDTTRTTTTSTTTGSGHLGELDATVHKGAGDVGTSHGQGTSHSHGTTHEGGIGSTATTGTDATRREGDSRQ